MKRIIETKRGQYRLVGDADGSVAISMSDNGDYYDFDKSPDVLTDKEVQERINEMDRMESSESVQDALINEIQALVEEYILSDDTYQDIYKELNWLGIGENKDDYRLNIEIRKNP